MKGRGFVFCLVFALAAPPASAQIHREAAAALQEHFSFSEATPEQRRDFEARRAEAKRASRDRRALAPSHSGVTQQFMVMPLFAVDVNDPGGLTSLFALRNTADTGTIVVTAEYSELDGTVIKQENFVLAPSRTLSRNIRDVGNLPADNNGLALGFVLFSTPSTSQYTGDFFFVDPSQNFASADRLTPLEAFVLCRLSEARFLQGGPFTGGTRIDVFTITPQGPTTPTALMGIFDEAGNLVSVQNFFTTLVTTPLFMELVLANVPNAPAAGTIEFLFAAGSNGGQISNVIAAENRYSVGAKGTCEPF